MLLYFPHDQHHRHGPVPVCDSVGSRERDTGPCIMLTGDRDPAAGPSKSAFKVDQNPAVPDRQVQERDVLSRESTATTLPLSILPKRFAPR